MKPNSLPLEDFDDAPLPAIPSAPLQESEPVDLAALAAEAEASRVEAYETGYKTGWDDAVRAAEEERTSVGEELARNLRDLSFTHFEAREELLIGMRAFLRELLDTMFPELLPDTAAAAVADTLSTFAEEASTGDIVVSICPDDAERLRSLMPLPGGQEMTVVEETALAPGQARVRSATKAVEIDADRIVTALREALATVAAEQKGASYG